MSVSYFESNLDLRKSETCGNSDLSLLFSVFVQHETDFIVICTGHEPKVGINLAGKTMKILHKFYFTIDELYQDCFIYIY